MKDALGYVVVFMILVIFCTAIVGSIREIQQEDQVKASMVQFTEEDDGWKLIGQKGYCKLYHKAYRNNQSVYWTVCDAPGQASVSVGQLNP